MIFTSRNRGIPGLEATLPGFDQKFPIHGPTLISPLYSLYYASGDALQQSPHSLSLLLAPLRGPSDKERVALDSSSS